jgi:hypothetical protein
MNLVSLLLLPAVIGLADSPIRFVIAVAALSVVLGAIAFSKRQTDHHAAAAEDAPPRVTARAP